MQPKALCGVQLEDGTLRVFKKVDTRRADELHGLTRYAACARDLSSLHNCPERKVVSCQGTAWLGPLTCYQLVSKVCVVRRAMANNMIRGTSEGWIKTMQLIGVGYRAAVSGKTLTLNLGYSNPVVFDIPEGLSCAVRSLPVVSCAGGCFYNISTEKGAAWSKYVLSPRGVTLAVADLHCWACYTHRNGLQVEQSLQRTSECARTSPQVNGAKTCGWPCVRAGGQADDSDGVGLRQGGCGPVCGKD